MNNISEQRLAFVYPGLADLIRKLDLQISLKYPGEALLVTFGLRTPQQQTALYAQGRKPLDQVNALRSAAGLAPIGAMENARRVTKAPAGYSWHEFGLAVDVAPLISGKSVDWDVSHPIWMSIVELGESLGLTSGISWHDEPHLQLTGKYPVAAPNDECRTLMNTGGISAVWQAAFSL